MYWIVWLTFAVVTFDPSLTQRRAIVSYPVTVSPPGAVSKPPIQPTVTRAPSRPPIKGDASPEPRAAPDALRPVYQDSGYRSGSTTNSSSSSRPTSDDRGEKGHRPYPESPRGEPKGRADGATRSSESILSGRDSSLPKGDFGETGRTLSKPPTRPLPLTPPNRDASHGSKGSDTGIDRDGVRRVEDGDRTSTAQKDDRAVSRDTLTREDTPVRPRLPLEREIRPKSDEKSNVDTRVRDADDYGASYPRTDPRPPIRDDYDKGRSRDRDFSEDRDSYEKGRSTVPRDYEDKGRASSDRDAYDERRRGDRDDYGRTDERRSYPSSRDYDKGRPSSIDDPRPYDRDIPRSDRDRDSTDRDRDPTPRRDSGRDRPRYDGDYDESDSYSKGRPPVIRDRDVYDDGRRVSDRGYSESDHRYDGEKSRRDSDYGVSRVADPRSREYDRRDEERGRDYYDDDGYRRERRPQGSRRDDDDDEYYRRRERPPDSRRKGDEDGRSYGEDRYRDRTDDDRYRSRDYSRDSEDRYRSPSRTRRPEDEDRYRSREDDDRYADRRDSDSRDDRYRDRDRRVEERRIRVEDRSSDRALPDSDRDGYSVRSRPDRPIDDRDRSPPALPDDRYRSDSEDEINARKRTDSRDDPPRDDPRSEISLRTVPERPKATIPDDRYRETSRGRDRPTSYDRGDDSRRDSDLPRSTVRDDKDRRDEPSGEDRYRDRSDRPYDERYRITSSRRSDESLGSRAREDSRYVDDRRDSSRAREPYDDKYYRDTESSRSRSDDYTDKGGSKSDDDYRRDQERTRSASSSERDVILSTKYLATDKGDSEGSKSDDEYFRTRSYSASDDDYDERDRRYSETSRSEAPRISSSRPRSRSEDYPSVYKDEERYRERPSRYDREGYRKGDSNVRSDEERYRYRRKSISEDEYRNAQEEDYRRGITRSDPSGHDRDAEVRRYDEKGSRHYMRNDEKFLDRSKGDQEERRRHYDERKDASEDKGSFGISRDDSDGNGRRKGDRDYTPGSRLDESREASHHSREDSRYPETSRGRKGAESRFPSTSDQEAVKPVICDDEAESSKRDDYSPPPPKSSAHPPPLVTSSRGSSGYDCGGDHVHTDSTMEHVSRTRDTADRAEISTSRPRDIYPSRSSDNLPSSKPVRSITMYDQFPHNTGHQSSSNVQNHGNRQEQKIPEARTNSSYGSGNNDNKYEKGISIPSNERQEARNPPQTTVIPSDPPERPLTLKEVIEAAYRHPDSPEPKGAIYYPVYDPRINNITSPEVIRPSERRGITISTKKRRK